MAATSPEKRHAAQVVRALQRRYPHAACALDHANPLQLLIATILSAQCTDVRVNQVTASLFRRFPTAADYAVVPIAQLEKAIQSTGFFRNKARNIQACCHVLVARYGGDVPTSLDDLIALPGVGRKTANVVLGTAFGLPTGVVVDTHVTRIARRLGLTRATAAEKIEQDLMAVLPKKEWIAFSHRVIEHGRQICQARKPRCDECELRKLCPRLGVPA
jgi:endonuclease-3